MAQGPTEALRWLIQSKIISLSDIFISPLEDM